MPRIKKQPTDSELMVKLATELDKESDRALVILAASYLENLLWELIGTIMQVEEKDVNKLLFEESNAPLSTFSSRINMAYCLGLIDKDQKSDLDQIRHIRNEFAHKFFDISFQTRSIADRCRTLKAASVGGKTKAARDLYKIASIRLIMTILLKIESKKKENHILTKSDG